jgi:hypothetical protein
MCWKPAVLVEKIQTTDILSYVSKEMTGSICVNLILWRVCEVSFAMEKQYTYIYIFPSVCLQP